MHRQPLLSMLRRYAERCPEDAAVVRRFDEFVAGHRDCLWRRCATGHITASAWIVSADHRSVLLTRHRKLGRWLQLGGHVDGDPHVERAALREAREESGMTDFRLVRPEPDVVPLDLDVHVIPPHREEPGHLHYDVRFLLVAAPGQPLRRSDESLELRWFDHHALAALPREESLLRMAHRAAAWLSAGSAKVRRRW